MRLLLRIYLYCLVAVMTKAKTLLETEVDSQADFKIPKIIDYPITENCQSDKQCQVFISSSICRKGKCICPNTKPILLKKQSKCVKVSNLKEDCEYDDQCITGASGPSSMLCEKHGSSSTCECKTGYIESNDNKTCVTVYLGSRCRTYHDCLVYTEFSGCKFIPSQRIHTCQCNSGYTRRGHKCIKDTEINNSPDMKKEDNLFRISIGTCSVIALLGLAVFVCSLKSRFKKQSTPELELLDCERPPEKENKIYTREDKLSPKQVQDKLAKAKKAKEKEIKQSEKETKKILEAQDKINKKSNSYCPMKDANTCKLVKISTMSTLANSLKHHSFGHNDDIITAHSSRHHSHVGYEDLQEPHSSKHRGLIKHGDHHSYHSSKYADFHCAVNENYQPD